MSATNPEPSIGDSVEAQFLGRSTTGEIADIRTSASISSTAHEYVLETDLGTIVVDADQLQ